MYLSKKREHNQLIVMSLSVINHHQTLLLEVPASIRILSPTFIPRVSSVISMGLTDDGLNMVLLLLGL